MYYSDQHKQRVARQRQREAIKAIPEFLALLLAVVGAWVLIVAFAA